MDDQNRLELQGPRQLSAFQPMPSSVELTDFVTLLTIAPLDTNPTFYKLVSVKMDLDEILNGAGELFEIAYGAI